MPDFIHGGQALPGLLRWVLSKTAQKAFLSGMNGGVVKIDKKYLLKYTFGI